jgi:hypothetical protein
MAKRTVKTLSAQELDERETLATEYLEGTKAVVSDDVMLAEDYGYAAGVSQDDVQAAFLEYL